MTWKPHRSHHISDNRKILPTNDKALLRAEVYVEIAQYFRMIQDLEISFSKYYRS